jgi:20S proteasome alpha/beta subunit
MICMVAGMLADGVTLIRHARQAAQRYLLTRNIDIPCDQLVRSVCDLKQSYTQHGGLRPFGVSIIYAGWDPQNLFQLYRSYPSGVYEGWKAISVGQNSAAAQDFLERYYNEDIDLEEACVLAINVLKTASSSKIRTEQGMPWAFNCIYFFALELTEIICNSQSNLLRWNRLRMGRSVIVSGLPTKLLLCHRMTKGQRKHLNTKLSNSCLIPNNNECFFYYLF